MDALLKMLAAELKARGMMMSTAESCTGGLIGGACTTLAGSSDWYERGFITYSNDAKTDMLGVPAALIHRHGAVSEEVACAMAEGALAHSKAHVAVAVTGVAGPSGGTPHKPVGTVWLAVAQRGEPAQAQGLKLAGSRSEVREQTVVRALQAVLDKVAP